VTALAKSKFWYMVNSFQILGSKTRSQLAVIYSLLCTRNTMRLPYIGKFWRFPPMLYPLPLLCFTPYLLSLYIYLLCFTPYLLSLYIYQTPPSPPAVLRGNLFITKGLCKHVHFKNRASAKQNIFYKKSKIS